MNFAERLNQLESRRMLKEHSLIRRMKSEKFNREQVRIILGQWYHPLRYFPMFVGRLIGLSPTLKERSVLAKILWQELGQGELAMAHEQIYIDTMTELGFSAEEFVDVEPFAATSKLVGDYRGASAADYHGCVGYVFATESADLLMVSAIGAAVRRAFGSGTLRWVDIHVRQEPDHTDCVEDVVIAQVDSAAVEKVLQAADTMFTDWCNFFSEIETALDAAANAQEPLAA